MLIHNLVATGSLSYNGVNISYVTGSQTSLDGLNQFSASVNETTGSLNSTTGSLNTATGSLFTASGSFSTRVTNIEGNYATTGSNVFLGAQTVCANITSTGTIIAQTLNVQQVTSSIVYSSGSNIFGCSLSNTQQFTGSVTITGSLNVAGNTCVVSICSPAHVGGTFSGTTIYGSTVICGASVCSTTGNNCFGGATVIGGCLGVGTATPITTLHIVNGGNNFLTLERSGATNSKQFNINLESNSQTTISYDCVTGLVFGSSCNPNTQTGFNERFKLFGSGIACFACRVCSTGLTSIGDIYFGVGASSYDQVSLCYSGYNSGTPLVTLFPTTVPGAGALTTQLLLKSNGLGGASGCNHMGLNVQSTTYLASCNGSVGIGTISPLNKLHVDGGSGIRVSDPTGANFRGIVFGATAGDSAEYSYIKWNPNSGEFRIYANTAGFGGYTTFYSNNNEILRITSAGIACFSCQICAPNGVLNCLGVGSPFSTTGGVYQPLQLKAGQANSGLWVESCADDSGLYVNFNSSAALIGGSYRSSAGYKDLILQTAGSNRMIIFCAGRVAINRSDNGGGMLSVRSDGTSSASNAFYVDNSTPAELFSVRNDGFIRTGNAAVSPYNNSTTGRSVVVESGGGLGYTSSTRESKTNINSIGSVNWINQLNPVSFNYRKKDDCLNYTNEFYNDKSFGFIADEVESVNPDFVFYNDKPDGSKELAGVKYESMTAVLVKAIQEQQCKIKILESCLGIN